MRERPSSTVTLVVEPSKVPPSGSSSVTEVTSSPSSTVPSQVRRVSRPPMTPDPPSSLGRAVALLVVRASASTGTHSANAHATSRAPSTFPTVLLIA